MNDSAFTKYLNWEFFKKKKRKKSQQQCAWAYKEVKPNIKAKTVGEIQRMTLIHCNAAYRPVKDDTYAMAYDKEKENK